MRWIAISGSWRTTNKQVEVDVRQAVRDSIQRGDGIVSGGALNVDYFATDEALRLDPTARQIIIFLPSSLAVYSKHYRQRAEEGVITGQQAENLIRQLTTVQQRRRESLIENLNTGYVDYAAYLERDTQVVEAADELLAFQVNYSRGVQDTIDKARARGKPVTVRTYRI